MCFSGFMICLIYICTIYIWYYLLQIEEKGQTFMIFGWLLINKREDDTLDNGYKKGHGQNGGFHLSLAYSN